ncbi:hypothetical protein C7M61_003643 [Candidozyma pseudohaemuli]|uniref:amidase n=1 Tax=Candidozyma pseudohaemuli TaxID=418784 RepID=A0A2P7YMK7_9ASCO|nr:hypothetical protein C7M61_003643 [[Candida] pseudohaemulonii]PSK37216.1 hypothetical protein C7M61_003643 [[Candida] pseudohaemulonii]
MWTDIAKRKQDSILGGIPPEWRDAEIADKMQRTGETNTKRFLDATLPEDENAITHLSLVDLQKKIAAGEFSALEVTTAYCHRAALAHQIVNCCSDIFFDEAFERAKKLDQVFAKDGVVGPLHGIPISLKDQVDLTGKDSTLGYCSLADKPKAKNALIADQLLEAGAVFYVKTAVPSSLMASETYSNLIGYTTNSLHLDFSAGGSSGGEGSLIAAGASPCGLGTDIGGSIRIPSCFQGLYALKPANGRLSYMNVTNASSGQECVISAIGPMARSLEDVKYVSKVLVGMEGWHLDPKVLAVPWREEAQRKFTIGIWHACPELRPQPPVARALEETKAALQKAGHEVVDIQIPMLLKAMDTATKAYVADAGKEAYGECSKTGEPFIKAALECVPWDLFGKPLDASAWWEVCNEAYEIKQDFYAHWKDTARLTLSGKPIDAIVCPIWPVPAVLKYGPNTENYTVPFNLFDCASTVLPVGKVDKLRDVKETQFKARNDAEQSVYDMYDPEKFHDLPVCLQVVTRKLEEERSLAVAEALDQAVHASR